MKKSNIFICLLLLAATSACAAVNRPLVYNGDTLEWNYDWTCAQSGTVSSTLKLPEISGIACSRVTPGYIWMQSDDYQNRVIATTAKGDVLAKRVKFNKEIRWDWEDMSGGVYNGTNYLFIGAFGDNDETDGNYHIVYFEEPAIDDGVTEITVTPSDIKFQYPGGIKHNAEALMYDNVDQVIYIITKVYYNVCQVFSLPFRLDYGDEEQTLSYVCDLGVKSDLGAGANPSKGFHLVTAADISPDGKYILIKNHNNITPLYSWVLLFTRQEGESVAETLVRQTHPEPLKCYEYEWQGEAICWLDSTLFYTTSDSDGEPPIYRYKKKKPAALDEISDNTTDNRSLVLIDHNIYIRSKEGVLFTLDGRRVQQ